MASWDSVGFDPGTFTDPGWGSIDKGIFGGSGSAPDWTGGQNYWDKGPIDTSPMGGTEGLYGGGGYDWGGVFGSLFKKAAQNALSFGDASGQQSRRAGSQGGGQWGGTSSTSLGGGNTLITTGGGSPFVVEGMPAKQTRIGLGPLSVAF